MVKEDKNWWKNPKSSAFWIVLLSVTMVILMFIFGMRPIVIVTPSTNQLVTGDSLEIDTGRVYKHRILNLEGPKQLIELLDKYPPIQAEETFKKFYKGGVVKWKGIVLSAFSQELRKNDISYHVILIHTDGRMFTTSFDEIWKNRMNLLNEGDTLIVQGKIDREMPHGFWLEDCVIVDE